MCGRYVLATTYADLSALFGELPDAPAPPPRYNIAPTQDVLTVAAVDGVKTSALRRWGLVPGWAKDPAIGNKLINARAETVGEKPSFRTAFKRRRCLVPMTGFYEWKRDGATKQPYFIKTRDPLFAVAGLWERWEGPAQTIESCTLLTTSANEAISAIHDRMPVIVPPGRFKHWLDPSSKTEQLAEVLVPYPADEMLLHPVSRRVSSPKEQGPELILAV
jgi:putative SOS response-associated peptidase YedK